MVTESDVCGPNSSLEFFVDGVVPECFMDVILFALNSAFIFLFGSFRIRQTLKSARHSIPTTPLYLVRLCTCLAGALIPMVQTIAILVRGDPEAFRVIAALYITASWLMCLFVVVFEYSRALRSSWIARLWGTSTFMLAGLALQSDVHHKRPGFDIFLSVMFTAVSFVFGVMVLFYNQLPEEYEKLGSTKDEVGENYGMEGVSGHTLLEDEDSEDEEPQDKNRRKPNPLSQANFISRITFQWLNPILRTGYKRPLELTDLFEPPSSYQTASIAKRFSNIWDDLRIQGKQTLFRAFVRLVGWDFFKSGLFKLAQDLLMFAGPVLLNRIVVFVKDPSEPQSTGFILVGLMFAAAVLQTLFVHQYFYITFLIGMEVRAAVVSAVYRKSFFLSNKARQQSTVGEIVNLQSIDANRFQDLFPYLHMIWSAPLQLIIAMFMLWQLLGPSCLAGVGVMILTVPANGVISKKLFGVQKIIMSLRDRRIKLMNEILGGMRIIKFFAWEDSFTNAISKIRNSELDTLRNTLWIRAVASFLWGATPTMVALCTFALYAVLGNNLTAEKAFTALALFNIIRFPMNMLPMIVNSIIESRVSLQRLSKFLLAEELDPNAVDVKPQESNSPIAISIREGSWAWESSSATPTLQNISLDIPRGKLVAVVGQVGGGKSSLLSAILGEITKVRGEVKLCGSTAYVAQQPWIQNATLRDNILFGTPFDQAKYDRVVRVCELTADINMLPNGDQTEIGEKGINLSGGQKQRLSVARAIYQSKDIYLLDDCLSAVDAHVGKAIFENAIMGELKTKTRVLVTHQLQFVWCADVIVVLKDGQISEMGSYDSLMKNQQDFYQLISTHVKKADESIANNQAQQSHAEEANGASKTPKADASTPSTPNPRAPQGKLIQAEEREIGHVDRKVWLAYFAAIGGLFFAMLVILCAAIEQSISVGGSFWLSHWSAALSENEETHGTAYYLGIYAALSVASTLMVFGRAMMINIAGLNSSRTFHQMMLQTIMRAPMSFFDTTPVGRILNRFSKDIYAIDESLPRTLGMLVLMLFGSAGIIFSIAVITPIFLIILLPLGYVYRYTQKFYLQSSREIQRLESITKSPVYAQFSETLSGVSTIRPYRRQDDFIAMNNNKVDLNISAYYVLNSSNRWLGVRLEFMGTCIVTVAAAFAVIGRSSVDPGLAGLSITSALNLTGMLNWLVRMATETETQMVSVERARQYTELPQEAPVVIEHNRPPTNWPSEGALELKDVKLRYREGLDLILKGISVSIQGKEKVGVVGRTGAGKSSLMLAIFRLVELAEGHIYIDGVDIGQIGLKDLRSKLSIIPQDPTLFTGTVRTNLDPFDQHTDKEVWDALQNVYLKGNIEALPEKLNAPVSEGGENFSVGQRQLLCLARAILRRAKIMVMDEATAAVDFETDALIQKTIREQFANVTVLTIAHRIHTILDYDKILVLDKGLVAEFDSPNNLLKNPNGIFYSMTHKSGTVDAESQ